MKKKILGLVVVMASLSATTAAFAGNPYGSCRGREECPTQPTPPAAAPEVDPASAVSALTLLAGSIVVLRGRFRRK